MTISVCMMVRNESEVLAAALRSVAGLADEVIVVDTGSTDNTVELARDLGATVITGGDRRNKASGRNLGLDAATGDWVVILDADEQVADALGVRRFLETTEAESVYIKETHMVGDQPTSWFHQMRAWRRGVLRYRYRAHEVPIKTGTNWPSTVLTDFVWEHRPPGNRLWKREHMLMLLCMDVEENPHDARPYYYLGREYVYLKAWDAALDMLNRYLSLASEQDNDRAEAWGHLATCYLGQDKPEEVRRCLHQALALQPQRRHWYGWLAQNYHDQGLHEQAAGLLLTARRLPYPQTGYVDELWYSTPHLPDLLARCLYYAGRKDEGLAFAREALALAPEDARLQANLAFFEQG
jgi:glycosyltransferase involved in cell wall biosynthesis